MYTDQALLYIDIILSHHSEMLWRIGNMEKCAVADCADITIVSMLSCATKNGHHVGSHHRDKYTLAKIAKRVRESIGPRYVLESHIMPVSSKMCISV